MQIALRASLLIILNENGCVLSYKVVNNDRREELYDLLLELWSTVNRVVITECVYSDNPKVDSSFILKAFNETKPVDKVAILYILLDIFHAKSRIGKEISKTHPDQKGAMADLSTIFAKLHHYNSYPVLQDLKEAFYNWMGKYSKVHAQLLFSMDQKLQLLGNHWVQCGLIA